jgi:hypothetical protein
VTKLTLGQGITSTMGVYHGLERLFHEVAYQHQVLNKFSIFTNKDAKCTSLYATTHHYEIFSL